MIFKTSRLEIKKIRKKDFKILVLEIGNMKVAKFLTNVPNPYSLQDAINWSDLVQRNKFQSNIYFNDSLIGGIGFKEVDLEIFELGYWLAYPYWGNGMATEAVNGALRFLNNFNNIEIFASYLIGNKASRNVLIKTGFNFIGEGEIFSIFHNKKVPCIKMKYYNNKKNLFKI